MDALQWGLGLVAEDMELRRGLVAMRLSMLQWGLGLAAEDMQGVVPSYA